MSEKKSEEENVIDEIESNVEEGLEDIQEIAEDIKDKEEKKKSKTEEPSEEKTKEEKKKALLEKVKKLKEKIDSSVSTEDLKEQVKAKKREEMLVPLEEYVKAGIYLGTRVVTPDMRTYVYRRRADGLAIFNTDLIDEKLKEGINYLAKFSPDEVILVCKRQAGWKAARMFSEITGIRVFTKKYPAGILTNTQLENFFEIELSIIADAWLDKNALKDTQDIHKNVLMICDTNNFSHGANQIVIGNNKSPRSLGLIFYLLARGYCKARGIKTEVPDLEMWTGDDDEKKGASMGV